ncbi:MAG: hypothetical protein MRY79_03225 [Alphaproteobacteria bacterium]|nr:hypothetical protein [Alphaproteobacteria bacterium]
MNKPKNAFGTDITLKGDDVYAQLTDAGLTETPRKPDVRLIIKNISDGPVQFKNPGGHSDDLETIPNEGKNAAMVVGDTLNEQMANAAILEQRYQLSAYGFATDGFTSTFIEDMEAGELNDLVREAYGPAPFDGQVENLKNVDWTNDDGSADNISPVKGENVAYGARPPGKELVFIARVPDDGTAIHLQGTGTVAEKFVSDGKGHKVMAVGVSPVLDDNWQPTGEFTTKPIALSVAREYYGEHFAKIPIVDLNMGGQVQSVNLNPAKVQAASNARPENNIA